MIRKLRWKFIGAAMLSLLLVLGAVIAIINVLNYRNLVREADEALAMLAETDEPMQFWTEPEAWDPGENGMHDRRHAFDGERQFQIRFFSVTLSETGEATDVNLRSIVTVDEETAVSMALEAQSKGREKGFSGNYRYLSVQQETGTRWIFLNREPELSTFRMFLWTSCIISLAGFAMVFLLLALFSSRIVRPIAQSYEKQKQFITDAGHELKTPITIIRADADVIEEDLGENEWLSDIRMQTDRLGTLTNDLIYLSRMEESAQPSMLDFPLSDVVQEETTPFSAIARTQNKSLSLEIQPRITLHGDEKAVRKLVSILLDNAMKYSPEQGEIALTLKQTGKQIRLNVTNTANNVEKGSADRLFDRFYRADASRNSETGGFGLGLSIAKAVVEAHKGRIHAWSADGSALTVEAVFPE
jgi:signal transduction histidine kinase